jgi:hypothetical protein
MFVKSMTRSTCFGARNITLRGNGRKCPNKSVYDGYEMAPLKGLNEYNSDNPPAGSVKRTNAQTFPNL